MKTFLPDEDIPEELCEKYHDILGISNFKTLWAHKALNAQLELEEKQNEVSIPTPRSD